MENPLFSDDIFRHDVEDGLHQDADDLNEETFGLCDDDLFEPNDDWEKQHEVVSKLIEGGSVVRNSPLKYKSQEAEIPRNFTSSSFERNQERHISLSDAEEEIIETTINSLGLDDDCQYEVKNNTPTKSMSFEESHLSWNSPVRGKEHRSDSLQELISPGDGVWASPSRDIWTPPSREGDMVWPSPAREGSLWSSPARESDEMRPSPLRLDDVIPDNVENHYNGNVIRKLMSANDDELADGMLPPVVTPTSPAIRNLSSMPTTPVMSSMPTTPIMSAIRVEDLERELKKESEAKQMSQPTIIERHHMTSPANSMKSPVPFPMLNPKDLHMKNVLAGLGNNQIDINTMTTLLINQQMLANYSQMMNANTPPPPLLPPPPGHPMMSPMSPMSPVPYHLANSPRYSKPENSYRHNNNKNWYSRTPRHDGDYRQYQRHVWHKELHPSKFREIDYEQYIQMEPSRMMNVKEKKWIFKISLMSLLNGDPHTSDYYFISHVTSGFAEKPENKKQNKEMRKNLERTNQLMTYVQQQQDTKESHRPVKFKGSLGKLSITSVHHPRQIMDFSTPEAESHTESAEPRSHGITESGKKKFMLYGTIEKMYSILLVIMDIERELDNKEQKDIVESRLEKIKELFSFFKIELQDSTKESNVSFFANIVAICKGRKLITRVFLLFNQEQSEALFISLITVLPMLLKKDKEETMLQLNGKLDIMLRKSEKQYRLKCIQLLRKIDLKILLMYSTSVLILATLLDLLEEKNHSLSLEWSYYVEEVPKVLQTMPDPSPTMQPQLDHLKAILGLDNLLGVNITS